MTELARSLDFYERAFGWPRNEGIDFDTYVELLPPGGGALGLFERTGYTETVGATPADIPEDRVSPAYLYVRVDDIDTAAERIAAAGGRTLAEPAPRSWNETSAWFADPDGNVIAIAQTAPIGAATPSS